MAVNNVIISGNITRLTTSKTGQSVFFNVAVRRNRKNSNGEYLTDFIPVRAYKENIAKLKNYKVGDKVSIVGKLTRTASSKDEKHYINVVILDSINPGYSVYANIGLMTAKVEGIKDLGEQNGRKKVLLSLSVEQPFGEKVIKNFFSTTVWGKTADSLIKYVKTGSYVFLRYSLRQGTGDYKYEVFLSAEEVQFGYGKKETAGTTITAPTEVVNSTPASAPTVVEDYSYSSEDYSYSSEDYSYSSDALEGFSPINEEDYDIPF